MNKMICKVKKTIQPKTLVDSSKRVYWNEQKFGWFNNISSLWNQSNTVNQMMSLEELFFLQWIDIVVVISKVYRMD